ncbi:MAG: signal recognition particle receptor subunit alpha [Thaumarchaeota archaeon]|nr:signal recognition particle receptor subunit alpha [Nitrososphaerota archaeon]
MLDTLRTGLRAAIKKVVSAGGVDAELIKDLSRDVQRALLQADVDVKIVIAVTKRIEERATEEKPPPGLSRKDHIVKILYDEIAAMLGSDAEFELKAGRQARILMLGIQGSGKTTTAAKLALHLTRGGYKVAAIGADTHRPGALAQLRDMCARARVEVYGEEGGKDAVAIVRAGLEAHGEAPDVIIIDTAGRHKEEGALLEEMRTLSEAARPDLALLVIDGTMGRQCGAQAAAFHAATRVGGIAITKLDSTAKGGGALAAASETGARVMYIGTGERIGDIERFSSTRFVGRLLGMGDVQAVLDMARRLEADANGDQLRRMKRGKMNMEDFYSQLEGMARGGSLRGMIESMPGIAGGMKDGQLDGMDERVERWRHIIQSMNRHEKDDPGTINASRAKRIARGSGSSEREVKELIKAFNNSKGMMKASGGRQMQGFLRKMGIG